MKRTVVWIVAIVALAAGFGCGGSSEQEGSGPIIIAGDSGGEQEDAGLRCQESNKEACNNRDDDCDGVVDEGCQCNAEGKTEGVCTRGRISDQGFCEPPAAFEREESTCDGQDNDCDGVVDEGCRCVYGHRARGVCANASISSETGECLKPDSYTEDESSCDGKDNDCDGVIDEGCGCIHGTTRECYTGDPATRGVGACSVGVETCDRGVWSGNCKNDVTPEPETCDDKDNDCDGKVDETEIKEGFESDSSGWQAYSGSGQPPQINTNYQQAYYRGSASGYASHFWGACSKAAGLAKDFSPSGGVNQITMQVAAAGGSAAHIGVALKDSNGTHILWDHEAPGRQFQMNWTKLTLDVSDYDDDFKLIIGNVDNAPDCDSLAGHGWTVVVDEIQAGPGCDT